MKECKFMRPLTILQNSVPLYINFSNFILEAPFPMKRSQTASKFSVFWVNLNSVFLNMN